MNCKPVHHVFLFSRLVCFLGFCCFFFVQVESKIHHLTVRGDTRPSIELTHFGYTMQGTIDVKITNFTAEYQTGEKQGVTAVEEISNSTIGFTLSKGDEVQEFVRVTTDCLFWKRNEPMQRDQPTVYFTLDLIKKKLKIERHSEQLGKLEICMTSECKALRKQLLSKLPPIKKPKVANRTKQKRATERHKPLRKQEKAKSDEVTSEEVNKLLKDDPEIGKEKSASTLMPTTSKIATAVTSKAVTGTGEAFLTELGTKPKPKPKPADVDLPLIFELPIRKNKDSLYSTQFGARFWKKEQEGLYHLVYHNCKNYDSYFHKRIRVTFTIEIVEKNSNSYLSAGEMPKPSLYFGLAALFFATGVVWVHIIRATKENEVYRIHYLMGVLVFIKSMSLLFHGVDYYVISIHGTQQEVWAVVYYIMHLLKGALLFGVIILIGTGYTFFKNFLTEKDRKLFMVVIPLQVLDNVALIITEESEEGQKNYLFWERIFIFIDLICCLAIILPVVWSIRHLQEASQTDGKAAFNLGKLRLFRHFYILIICYIYLTRILKYLVAYVMPFHYTWLIVLVEEVGTWFFFVVTGYKFKPAPNNPYLKLSQSEEDLEMEEPITQSGVLEGVTRLKRGGSFADTSRGSPEGEELLGEDVVYSKETYERSAGSVNTRNSTDNPGPDIY